MTPGYFAANAFPVRAFPDLMWLAFGTLGLGLISDTEVISITARRKCVGITAERETVSLTPRRKIWEI